ncbi:ABC transporter permease [Bacillus sp. FJAT-42315]|uniref:ABC transporter permease n=1 Tax=Bacillus sp. FJAT-42315 TaxID=2014077 RepID=UPI000C235321|nr:iron export ABC transporter permease subunit FetB [Bacillus sp. FJAT-42315]
MSLFTLSSALVFVFLAIILSKSLKLGLEKDLLISACRATIQLLLIGYVLSFIFSADHPLFILLMISLMIGVAAQNVVKKGHGFPGIHLRVLATLVIIEIIAMTFLLGLNIIPPAPRYVIPISGMIIGSSMVICSLLLNRLKAELQSRKAEVLVILSLGGSPKQAIQAILKDTIRSSLIPTIDGTKTIGLVQLPGMMTGQIIAGADPIQAVRYQLIIVFSLLAMASLTSIILGLLLYPSLFNQHQQLIFEET